MVVHTFLHFTLTCFVSDLVPWLLGRGSLCAVSAFSCSGRGFLCAVFGTDVCSAVGTAQGKNGTAREKLGTARFDGPECFETPDSTARDSGRPGRLQARPPIKLERESGLRTNIPEDHPSIIHTV